MTLTRTTVPASYPVTREQVKADLRVQHTSEDDLIDSLIEAATGYMDVPNGVIGKALITQTWALTVSSACGKLDIPVTPVRSITSIEYYDADNAVQSLDPADFYLVGDEDSAYIEPKSGSWPGMYDRPDALTVTFEAGFGAAEDVPAGIRQAIRMLVAHWYEHRMAATDKPLSEAPLGVQSLVNLHRKGWVA